MGLLHPELALLKLLPNLLLQVQLHHLHLLVGLLHPQLASALLPSLLLRLQLHHLHLLVGLLPLHLSLLKLLTKLVLQVQLHHLQLLVGAQLHLLQLLLGAQLHFPKLLHGLQHRFLLALLQFQLALQKLLPKLLLQVHLHHLQLLLGAQLHVLQPEDHLLQVEATPVPLLLLHLEAIRPVLMYLKGQQCLQRSKASVPLVASVPLDA